MQDREFEKDVQQKMQDLRFAPGADVWARVQADLRRKKRRRPVVLWFLLAGLLIGGASAWYLGIGTEEGKRQEARVKEQENKEQGNKEEGNKEQVDMEQESKEQENKEQGNNEEGNKEQVNMEEGKKQPVHPTAQTARLAVKKQAASHPQSITHNHARATIVPAPDANPVENISKGTTVEEGTAYLKGANIRMGAEENSAILVQVADPSVNEKESSPEIRKPVSKPLRLQWGVTAGAGISDLGNELLRVGTVADLAYGTPGMAPTNVPRASTIRAGSAFHAGVFVATPVSRKLKLKIGANYEFYSNNIQVGDYEPSARFVNQGASGLNIVQDYYKAGTSNKYSNAYHFISVPLSLQWQINNHAKRGLIWENGFSYARLVHTNALHFDGISGTYYEDNSVFKKNQWTLASSLLFSLKAKNKTFYIGPQVQYGISSLVKDAGSDKHLRYAGIKMAVGF